MKHLDDNMIYRLAKAIENDMYFDNEEEQAMDHIGECQDCYEKLLSMQAVVAITDTPGSMELREILEPQKESMLAVISVAVKKIKDKVSVVMDQAEEILGGLLFEVPIAAASRGIGDNPKEVKKLESIDNEKTYVTYDPDLKELFVQIDMRDIDDELTVYITDDNGSRSDIPLEQKGKYLKGSLKDAPTEFKLYIEKK